jgi:hypothetical protein
MLAAHHHHHHQITKLSHSINAIGPAPHRSGSCQQCSSSSGVPLHSMDSTTSNRKQQALG